MKLELSIPRLRQTAMIGALLIATAASSRASSLYTATLVGNQNVVTQTASGITNTSTGLTYAFATTTLPAPHIDPSKLPSVIQINGATNGYEMAFPMRVLSINSAGTILGEEPTGGSRAEPWSVTTIGYALRTADGSYGPFTPLVPVMSNPEFGRVFMNDANQFLYAGGFGMRFTDLKTGKTTDLYQIIPPALLLTLNDHVYIDEIGGIDNRGDLLVSLSGNGFKSDKLYILTPPDLAAPLATPEPSTMIAFAGLAVILGLRARYRGIR